MLKARLYLERGSARLSKGRAGAGLRGSGFQPRHKADYYDASTVGLNGDVTRTYAD